MALLDDINTEVNAILAQPWNVRDGQVVPETANVVLAGGAVKLQATMMYADLADSTSLATHDKRIAARAFKTFLAACTRVVRNRGGYVRSFDGDRIMAVFIGDSKNTAAARAALNIHHVVANVLRPKLQAKYDVYKNGTFTLRHCTGIDTGEVLVVRAGIGNNNDLVWVGSAPNVAAKLSGLRADPYNSWITASVYNGMNNEVKVSQNGQIMWEQRVNVPAIPGGIGYRSSWTWAP